MCRQRARDIDIQHFYYSHSGTSTSSTFCKVLPVRFYSTSFSNNLILPTIRHFCSFAILRDNFVTAGFAFDIISESMN